MSYPGLDLPAGNSFTHDQPQLSRQPSEEESKDEDVAFEPPQARPEKSYKRTYAEFQRANGFDAPSLTTPTTPTTGKRMKTQGEESAGKLHFSSLKFQLDNIPEENDNDQSKI